MAGPVGLASIFALKMVSEFGGSNPCAGDSMTVLDEEKDGLLN
jgi:hypothetical protein